MCEENKLTYKEAMAEMEEIVAKWKTISWMLMN